MVKRKIGYAFYDLYEDNSLTDALTKLYTEEPLISINNLLSKYLNLQIRVNKVNKIDPAMEIHFDRSGRRVDTTDLSSGEKGILHFIFTLYGFDLENGVIVIDEPELHLHPQIQREYQAIINDIVAKLDIQFIIATHSPIFVGVETIEEVYRFFKIDGHTDIVHPTIAAPQKALGKILDLTNCSKIFFVTQVILVEGETDEYFLRFYLDYLRSSAVNKSAKAWQRKIEDYEIININGKGARKTWTEFLEAYGLHVAFVGDWDNVTEIASFDLEKYTDAYQKALTVAGTAVQKEGSADGAALFASINKTISDPSAQNIDALKRLKDYIAARVADYAALIRHIQTNDLAEWTRLETAIDSSYGQKIFILKKGVLEDYLGVQKGIEHLIAFCENRFESWLANSAFNSFRNELDIVIERIFL